jgi:hypothetical protein
MKFQKFTFISILLLGLSFSFALRAQTPVIGLQNAAVDCTGATPTLCMDFVLSTDTEFGCSGWVIDLSYNSAALTTSTGQVTINPVFNDVTNYATATTIDSPAPGRVLLSSTLNAAAAPFPITSTPRLLATVCFTITNQTLTPNFSIANIETYVSDMTFATLLDGSTVVNPVFPTSLACPAGACDGVIIVPNATAGATTCGNSNGTIATAPTGGAAPYTTAISGGGASGSLAAGTYTVTVTDNNGCSATQGGLSVAASSGITASASATDNTSCAAANGTASVTVSSGNTGATFVWSNGGTAATLTGLAGGTYSVTATKDGCTATASTTVNNAASSLAINVDANNPSTCGASNGSATVSATGASGAVTYAWSNSTTGATATGLAAGLFFVTATDGAGCTASTTVIIEGLGSPSAAIAATHTSCGNNNGAANLTVTGGTAPLTFAWSNSAASEDLSDLAAGSYGVTVTDGNGCTAAASTTINASTATTASAMGSGTSCGLNNGSAMVMPSGATTYTYNWSNGATTASLANLAAGTYNVTVTGNPGACVATASFTVDASTGVTASASATQTACGAGTGTATVSATGSGALSYAWSPNVSTSASASDLTAGTYSITVTDNNGCTAATSATVTTAGGPSSAATTTTNATCGNANGTITVTGVTGGLSPYTYSLDGGAAQTSSDFSGVAAGAHTLTTTDSNGCSLTTSVTVGGTAGPSLSVSSTPGQCGSSNGTVNAIASGGTAPLTYSWTLDGATISGEATLANQESGLYAVTVTDANGCTAAGSTTLTCGTAPICDPANNGGVCALSLIAGGGGGGIASLIPVPAGDAIGINYLSPGIANNSGYVAGFYICTDALCTDIVAFFPNTTAQIINPTAPLLPNVEYYVMTAVVLEADPFDLTAPCHKFGVLSDQTFIFEQGSICESTTITVTTEPYSCAMGLQVSASGGAAPYQFNPPVGTALTNGTTNITVIDANGCIGTGSISVSNANINGVADYDCTDGLSVTISEGPAGATYSFNPAEGTVLANGSYQITVTASNGCSTTFPLGVECAVVGSCDGVTISGTASYSCTTGLSVSGSGGTAPYTYSTANGATLANGNYNITITDANGCSGVVSVSVNCVSNPCDGVSITGSAVYDCNGGGLTISGSGGTAPYSFVANGNALSNGVILTNGSYTINIFDANGCGGQTTLSVSCACTTPSDASTMPYAGGALCNSANEGMSTVDLNSLVTGDTGGAWSGQGGASTGTFDADGLAPGIYVVTYTVATGGCPAASSTQSFVVADCNPSPVANNDESFASNGTGNVSYDVTNNDNDLPVGCSIGLISVNSITPAGAATLVDFTASGVITLSLNAADVDVQVSYTIEDCVGQTASAVWTINVTDCGANAGALVQPAHAKYCADNNVTFQHNGLVGGAYGLAYAVVNTETDELAYYGANVGSLPSAAVPPIAPSGVYQIYGVSYELSSGLPTWPVAPAACADVTDPITVNIFAPLDTAMAYHCNGDGTIDLAILVYGGVPSFYGTGAYLINFPSSSPLAWQPADLIAGTLAGYTHYDAAMAAISDANLRYAGAGLFLLPNMPETIFDGGAGFSLDVDSDGALCDNTWFINMPINCPPPPPCDPQPGVMTDGDLGTAYVCAGDLATVTNIGALFQDYDGDGNSDEVISYVLWDPTDSLSTVMISADATFNFVPLTCPSYYLAAAAVGPDGNSDGFVDWDDICTKFTPNAQPVVFLCPIEATETIICDGNTGTFQIILENITGGLPQVAGGEYTYSGNVDTVGVFGQWSDVVVLGPFSGDSTAYYINITDGNDCALDPAISGISVCIVRAIELLSFTGEVQNTGNLLEWVTASEIENDYFTLMRSTNGVDFEPIATIDGAGTSNVGRSYSFMDKNAPAGLSYYRLDETNFEGKVTTAGDVITLTRNQVGFDVVSASPVPAVNSVDITFTTASASNVNMNIYDATGKLVINSDINAINGVNTVTIDLTNYAAGVYFVQLNDGTKIVTARIAKEQ